MTFYINKIHIEESDWEHECIGLFNETNWVGEGNFCGWYGVEFYTNTTLSIDITNLENIASFNMYIEYDSNLVGINNCNFFNYICFILFFCGYTCG